MRIGRAKVSERLSGAGLDPAVLSILKHALRRLDDADVLWVDDLSDLDGRPVAFVVWAHPLPKGRPLVLNGELVGDTSSRDRRVFVFIDEVCAAQVTTLPNTLAVFAGGLSVDGVASLSAPDADTFVSNRLAADVLMSGLGDGGVSVSPATHLAVRELNGWISGTTDSADLLPFARETIEDDSVRAAISDAASGHLEVPADFHWPRPVPLPALHVSAASLHTGRIDSDGFAALLSGCALSTDAARLLRSMCDYFFEGDDGGVWVVAALADVPPDASVAVVVVTGAVDADGPLNLAQRTSGGWTGYLFLGPVSTGDVFTDHEVVAVFAGGLTCRAFAPAWSDAHVHVDRRLVASMVLGTVYVDAKASFSVGAIANRAIVQVDQPQG